MKIQSLLDRYEILFPDNIKIADLRRSVVDHDISSVFRLCRNDELRKAVLNGNIHSILRLVENADISGSVEDLRKVALNNDVKALFRLLPTEYEDLRKAVVDKNIWSLFRILDDCEEIRKIVVNENIYSTFRFLESVTDTYFTTTLKKLQTEKIKWNEDCFSRGQVQSKKWLIEEVEKCCDNLGTVFMCAGWYGTLATMLFESNLKLEKIRSFDIDPDVWRIAELFNHPWTVDGWKFKASTQDILEIDFSEHNYTTSREDDSTVDLHDFPDTIINTSFEHIVEYKLWWSCIPAGKLVIVQCNNYESLDEHVSCAESLEHFATMAPIRNLLYEGELKFEKYTRYMRIGYK